MCVTSTLTPLVPFFDRRVECEHASLTRRRPSNAPVPGLCARTSMILCQRSHTHVLTVPVLTHAHSHIMPGAPYCAPKKNSCLQNFWVDVLVTPLDKTDKHKGLLKLDSGISYEQQVLRTMGF